MNIVLENGNKPKCKEFKDIKIGTCFKLNNQYYIRTKQLHTGHTLYKTGLLAVNLETGGLVAISPTMFVLPISECEIRIGEL